MASVLKFSLLLLFVIMIVSPLKGDVGGEAVAEAPAEEESEPEIEKSCRKWTFDLVSTAADAFYGCVRGGFKIKGIHEVFTRIFCLIKCVIDQLGLLDEKGNIDQVSAAVFFGDNFPASLRNVIVPAAEPCFAFAEKFDGTEYYCRSYSEFVQCAAVAVSKAFLPFAIECFAADFVGLPINAVFGVLKGFIPQNADFKQPPPSEVSRERPCLNPPVCDKFYTYKRMNVGNRTTTSILVYNAKGERIATESRKGRPRGRAGVLRQIQEETNAKLYQ